MASELNLEQHQPIYVSNNTTSTLIGTRKRQLPILTCTAHVFQIDPITKKSWIPSSTTALPVSFFYDGARGLYRIICTDGNKTLINSTLLPGMNFTKTSQKFGQWSDKQTNTVYGLGFSSENELEKFDEQFQVVKETLRTSISSSNNGLCHGSPAKHSFGMEYSKSDSTEDNYGTITSAPPPSMDMNANALFAMSNNANKNHSNSNNNTIASANNLNTGNSTTKGGFNWGNLFGSPAKVLRLQQQQQLNGNCNSNTSTLQNIYNSPKHVVHNAPLNKLINESLSLESSPSNNVNNNGNGKMANGHEALQLKYENEKLRQALQQSSANTKIWEYELATLKQNNAKLTTALQECNINVEDWKHQLQMYKEENQCLRLKILDIETDVGSGGPGGGGQHISSSADSELGKQLDGLRNKVNYYSKLLDDKNEQINCLKFNDAIKMNIFPNEIEKNQNQGNDGDIMLTSIQTVHSQLQTTIETQDFQKKVLEALAVQLSTKLHDLTSIQDKMKEALESSLR